MALSMKGIGRIIKLMGRGNLAMLMEMSMKESGWTTRLRVMEFILI